MPSRVLLEVAEVMKTPDHQLFASDSVKIGQFRASPGDGFFRYSGPPRNHLFVFPREAVWIEHEGRAPFVADPNVVTFYNPDQEYYRSPVSRRGDHSEWFALTPETLDAQLSSLGLTVDANGESEFPFVRGPSDALSYLEQRRIVRRVLSGHVVDALEIEERVIALAARVIRGAAGKGRRRALADPPTAHRELAERAREVLAARFDERLSIAAIAKELATSPFHLCRVFRAQAGWSLHQYRMRLRLAAGLLRLNDRSLTDLALDLGFSSHSHFSAAFHRFYGEAPREVRESLE